MSFNFPRMILPLRFFLAGAMMVSFWSAPESEAQTANDWFKACARQEENDFCNVQFAKVAETGQLLVGVALAEFKGRINQRIFQVQVPSGRFIPPGVTIRIDSGEEIILPYVRCFPQYCLAEIEYDDAFVNRLKSGAEMMVVSQNVERKENPIPVTLQGFTVAYDLPPIQRDELQARQRKLQEELQEKAQEQRRKLQEAQEKARQSDGEG